MGGGERERGRENERFLALSLNCKNFNSIERFLALSLNCENFNSILPLRNLSCFFYLNFLALFNLI